MKLSHIPHPNCESLLLSAVSQTCLLLRPDVWRSFLPYKIVILTKFTPCVTDISGSILKCPWNLLLLSRWFRSWVVEKQNFVIDSKATYSPYKSKRENHTNFARKTYPHQNFSNMARPNLKTRFWAMDDRNISVYLLSPSKRNFSISFFKHWFFILLIL